MGSGYFLALDQGVRNARFVAQGCEDADHQEYPENAELVRAERARQHHEAAQAYRLNDELGDHVVAHAARNRLPERVTRLHWRRLCNLRDCRRAHMPPPRSIAGMVLARIRSSPANDQPWRYCASSWIISYRSSLARDTITWIVSRREFTPMRTFSYLSLPWPCTRMLRSVFASGVRS